MQILMRCNDTHDRTRTGAWLNERIARGLGRFAHRIMRVVVSAGEERHCHGAPRAWLSIDLALADGGTVRVDSQRKQLNEAVSDAMDSLRNRISRDPRLGKRDGAKS